MEQQTNPPLEVMHISKRGRYSEGREDVSTFLEGFAEAIRNGNIEKIMSYYSKDIVAFDMMPPLSFQSIHKYKENWEKCFTEFFSFPVNYSYEDLKIDVSGDLAVARAFIHMNGDSIHGENMDAWLRTTLELKKIDGRWLIFHEHNSVPLDEVTMKGMMNLSPTGGESSYQH